MPDRQPPIFIVGAPRSGTTLLATLLSSHSRISCGAETHFFPYLEANYPQLPSLLQDPNWPHRATQFMGELDLEGHPVHHFFGVSLQAINDYLKTRKPSLQALLESLTEQHMTATQKVRWAEKTPNHLLHLDAIRRLYPAARIVRIVRDPRDSALSIAAKLPWASDSPLDNAYLIDRWYRKSRGFFQRDELTYTLRYEDLVAQPEPTLQTLCTFLQENFESAMLNTQAAAQHTAPAHETWKSQVGQGLDTSRCFVWQNQKTSTDLEAISAICQEMIEAFAYQPLATELTPIFAHHISDRFVRSRHSTIQNWLQQGYLLVPCHPLALSAAHSLFYCDLPFDGKNYRKSLRRFSRFCIELLALRRQGVSIQFSELCQTPTSERNLFGKAAAFLLRRLGQKSDIRNFIQVSLRS